MRFRTQLVLAGLSCLLPVLPAAAKTAFRITDLDWRDPHVYMEFLGCRDVTDTPFLDYSVNGDLQTRLQADSDGDGVLDLNYLIVFDPLDQGGSGGTLRFGLASCTAPVAGTVCEPASPGLLMSYPYDNLGAECLGILDGTTRPYTPAVTAADAPCFVATLGTITLDLGFPITLRDTYLAARYDGAPATNLIHGLLRGFLTETDANATMLPESQPIVGGQPLSVLLPGGDPGGSAQNCAGHSDKDIGPNGEPGWYMYFNFIAAEVQFDEYPTAVHGGMSPSLVMVAPHPNPFNPTTSFRYTLAAAAPVRLDIYDASGGLVARLLDGVQEAGEHEASWNGRDARGSAVNSGVYFARLESRGETQVRKIVLLK